MPQARFYGFAADRRHYKLIAPKGETTHYILCVAVLLQNVFAVHRLSAAGCVEGPRKKILRFDSRLWRLRVVVSPPSAVMNINAA